MNPKNQNLESRISRDRVLDTDVALHDMLEAMLQNANRRQMWLLLLDERQRLVDPVMPMDDLPPSPDELSETLDLGAVPFIEVLVNRAESVREMVSAGSVVFVWEREGPERFTAEDRGWARAAAHEAAEASFPLRAQFVLHDHGLRQITADDYA